jgi:hypothetical protein
MGITAPPSTPTAAFHNGAAKTLGDPEDPFLPHVLSKILDCDHKSDDAPECVWCKGSLGAFCVKAQTIHCDHDSSSDCMWCMD